VPGFASKGGNQNAAGGGVSRSESPRGEKTKPAPTAEEINCNGGEDKKGRPCRRKKNKQVSGSAKRKGDELKGRISHSEKLRKRSSRGGIQNTGVVESGSGNPSCKKSDRQRWNSRPW